MFEEIITRLLQGQFICEASAPSLFRQLDTESYRDDVDQYLARINRRLSVTRNRQAYYATWLRVGPDQRAEAKRVMTNIKQVLHPIVKFLAMCMDCQGTDIAPSPGDRVDYPAMLQRITENPHLLEQLREFSQFGKEYAASDASPAGMLSKVITQLEKAGYLVLFNRAQEAWRFTGMLDYYYEVVDFLTDHDESIQSEPEDDSSANGRLF